SSERLTGSVATRWDIDTPVLAATRPRSSRPSAAIRYWTVYPARDSKSRVSGMSSHSPVIVFAHRAGAVLERTNIPLPSSEDGTARVPAGRSRGDGNCLVF